MSKAMYDNLVIGGGISGLGLAHGCVRRGLATLVLEAEPRPGGCIRSHAFPNAGGFWLELGSHTCYNSYGHLLGLVADLDLVPALREKAKVRFRLLQGGRLASVFAALHPLELALSLPRLATTPKAGNSVQGYYGRVLGARNYRDLFGPAFNAVVCQPAADFPADALFRRKPRRKDMPRSFTLPGGLSAIVEALATQPGLELTAGDPVTRILRETDGFRVVTAAGAERHGRHLTLALPPDRAAVLLAPNFPELAQVLADIGMAEIDSVGVMLPRTALAGLAPLAGIIAPDDAFFAAVARDYLDDPDYRGLTFHFRPGALDAEGQLQRICEVLGVSRADLAGVERRRNRLPALRPGHHERVRRLDALLPGTGLALTGNYFLGVSIEDCLTRSAAELGRLFGATPSG